MTPTASDPAEALACAKQDAQRAARSADVQVRELATLEEQAQARALWDRSWRSASSEVSPSLLRAIEHAGGYAVGAYDSTDVLVGAAIGVIGQRSSIDGGRPHLHSHIAAVDAHAGGRGVGRAIKLHQRHWCLQHHIQTVVWTFDPLVRRNAHLNLSSLGAMGVEYIPDFYGALDDDIDATMDTDRVLVHWNLTSNRVAEAARTRRKAPTRAAAIAGGAQLVLDDTDVLPAPSAASTTYLVSLPSDIVSLRRSDPEAAGRWREVVRNTLMPMLAANYAITGITAEGDLIVSTDYE